MGKFADAALGDVIELTRGYDLPQQDRLPGRVPIVTSSSSCWRHSKAMARGPGVITGRYGTLGLVFYVTEDFWPLNTTLYVRDFKGNNPDLSTISSNHWISTLTRIRRPCPD